MVTGELDSRESIFKRHVSVSDIVQKLSTTIALKLPLLHGKLCAVSLIITLFALKCFHTNVIERLVFK